MPPTTHALPLPTPRPWAWGLEPWALGLGPFLRFLKGGVETYLSTFSYVIRDRPPACEADPSTPHRKYNFQLPNSEEVSAYMHILSCTYDGGWTSRWAITISSNHTYLIVLTMGGGRHWTSQQNCTYNGGWTSQSAIWNPKGGSRAPSIRIRAQ